MEAIASRPLRLTAVGKASSHANQTAMYLAPHHGRADILKRLIANIAWAKSARSRRITLARE